MIITYLRSSSYGSHSLCEQQYFLEYVLGIRGPGNKKADKGTICHKVLEILASIKLTLQNNETYFNDDVLGQIDVNNYNLDDLIINVYNYYTAQFKHHEWELKDFKDCRLWVNKALTEYKGSFDPRNRTIVQPEQHFDLLIEKPWAKYKYDTKDGVLEGYLAIKGTIDLITKIDDKTYEVVDWKTGRRLDWATGEEKTLAKLQDDPQLRMYHYAVSKLYPNIEYFVVSINFINDGGAFSIYFDKSDLPKTETMLRKKFEIIKESKKPQLNKTWKCTKFCHFGKTTFEDTHVKPIKEYRPNQTCSTNQTMTKCEQVKHDIDLMGMSNVVDTYTLPGYSVGKYKAPGSVE
jgi:hypothetical protein